MFFKYNVLYNKVNYNSQYKQIQYKSYNSEYLIEVQIHFYY